jgi:hypothetical protein
MSRLLSIIHAGVPACRATIKVFTGLLFVCLSAVMMPVLAAETLVTPASDDYWVVGSFKTLANADMERERIERLTAEHVAMAAFYIDDGSMNSQSGAYRDGAANIRLLVRKSLETAEQRQHLQDKGLAPWSLSVDAAKIAQFEASVAARGEVLAPEYWLVLGSFHGPERARNERDNLRKAGIDAVTIHRLEANGRYYFRVDHGPFDRIIASQKQRFVGLGITDAFWTRAHDAVLLDVE